MEGTWTITKIATDLLTPPYRDHILGPETGPTEVVPCDDAAIERGMNALEASDKDYRYVTRADIRTTVEAVLRAARETP